jgi:PKD repeat protein
LPNNYVKDVAVDARGIKWFATLGGAVSFDGENWSTFTSELHSDDVWDVYVDAENWTWFATTRSVSAFDGAAWTTYEEENGMPEENSRAVQVDSSGQVWVGTRRGGLNRFDGSSWAQYTTGNSGIVNNSVWDVDFESASRIWIGTNGGVSLLESGGGTVAGDVAAEFSGSPRRGDAPLTVAFRDQSTGNVADWHWDFGDGGASTEQNPVHTYRAGGSYSVTLSVAGPGGSDSESKMEYITITVATPTPDFAADITRGLAPLVVRFQDRSTGCIDTWKYDFDGDGSDDWSDSHSGSVEWSYASAGVYGVRLKVRDCETGRYYARTRPAYITVNAPIPPGASFSAFPTSGAEPLTVAFTDESTGDVFGWNWAFGDGATSTEQHPLHQYGRQGTYTVTLTASGPASADTITRVDLITVGPPAVPVADFGAAPLSGSAPLEVRFRDLSTGSITSWDWDFGDNRRSAEKNPVHTFGPGAHSVTLTVAGPLGSDTTTREDYITVQQAPTGGAGVAFVDLPTDLDNTHPHLWCKGYGPDNGLWQKAQTTHAEIWQRLVSNAPTGNFGGISRTMRHMQTPMAFVISKDPAYGAYCQDMVRQLNGHHFRFGGDTPRIAEMETFISYCLAYDAIVDDPDTTWLTAQEKADALATMAATLERLNFAPGDTWRRRPTHNFMVLRAGMHAAALYNLRGEPGYEELFRTSREYALTYHNERVNGLCDAPLQNHGPRPDDGFPYEGPNYTAYQGSRALVHRHILEMNEYPNPDTIVDENRSGFSRGWNLAWMAISPPGLSEWTDVAYRGDHGVVQSFRYYAAVSKAVGDGTLAGIGEWFTREVLRTNKGTAPDTWWWQGWEMMFYDASIEPVHPDDAGLPKYVHLDDSEFHMYRDSWDIASSRSDDTYVYFRNSAHDGHYYWDEGHGAIGMACGLLKTSNRRARPTDTTAC